MNLINRLSLYALASLAVVLVGFSVALYFLAATYLHHQANHRLEAALQTLVASTEVFADHVEWEPLLRRITLGEDEGPDQLRWTVHSSDGRLIDCSRNLEHVVNENVPPLTNNHWRVLAARVSAGSFEPLFLEGWESPRVGSFHQPFPSGESPSSTTLRHDRTFNADQLIFTVALNQEPITATLRQLAIWLGLLSLGVWLLAALLGRRICRRALAPVTRMANTARAIRQSNDQKKFLEVSPTHDELEDLGLAFNELLADLRESLERQQRFAGDASHQLRTPLGAMLTAVEVVLRQDRSVEEYRRALETVRRRGGQLTQIIESLLFLARPENAAVLPESEHIELEQWCHGWLEGWQSHVRSEDIHFHAEGGPFPIRTYSPLLRQVLDNLLDNACKYSEAKTPITIRLTAKEQVITISVIDQGCGISPADCQRLFEPFFRTEQARWLGKAGTGLGLTVVHRLIRILGATLEVTSQLRKGSEFRLHLVRPNNSGNLLKAEEHGKEGEQRITRSLNKSVNDDLGVNKSRTDLADLTQNSANLSAALPVREEDGQ
ncbi:MAG: HAMP domain-containing histidine kinase [Gemmataceae bacterium]|jgi:signal transduction histidine kinase|nr:HAMP domain-containing histidine kinase [Gemmataceae bacterium]